MIKKWSVIQNSNWRIFFIVIVLFFLLFFYFLETRINIENNLFGGDYLAFWSAGKIAYSQGYSQIYSSTLTTNTQLAVLNSLGISETDFNYIPFPYLSILAVPFLFLSKIDFLTSYWIWVIINWLVLIGYLGFFTRLILPNHRERKLLYLAIISIVFSFPVFNNFSWGQIDVLFLVCAGEIIRNSLSKKPVATGIWIGLLVLKPQLIILILPALLLQRSFNVIKGVVISSSLLLSISLLLSGFNGMAEMLRLWSGYVPGMATNFPEGMMNWRMVGLRLNGLLNNNLGWIVAVLGMLVTLYYSWNMIKKRPQIGSIDWVICYLGIFAATCAFTWHSHVHMEIVLIPFLLYGFIKQKLPAILFDLWIFVTPIILAVLIIVVKVKTGISFFHLLTNGHGFLAPIYLGFNMVVCYLVIKLPAHIGE